jgi:hypothetical protein
MKLSRTSDTHNAGSMTETHPPSVNVTIQPLRGAGRCLQYHIDIDFRCGFSSTLLVGSLEAILPAVFEHMDSLVQDGVVNSAPPPYQLFFAGERSCDSAPDP